MKWWLLSDGTADEVIRALKIGQAIAGGTLTASTFADALHSLESGMYETDAVPATGKASARIIGESIWATDDEEGGAG